MKGRNRVCLGPVTGSSRGKCREPAPPGGHSRDVRNGSKLGVTVSAVSRAFAAPPRGSRAESQAPDPVVSRLGPLPCVSSGPGPGKLQTRSLRKPWPSVCFSAFLVWRSGGRSPKNSVEASGEEWSYHPVCPRGAPAAGPQDSHTLLPGDLCSSSDASSGAQPGAGLWARPSHPSPPVLLSRSLSPFVLWENFQLRKGPC